MKIYTPDVVGKVSNRDTEAGAATPVVMHSHANKSVLDKISISETGELLYDSKALGSKPSNEEVLSKLSVTQGRLVYNGQPVDTVGHEFVNSVVLDQFSVVDGILMFNGQPVDTTGHVFSNVSVLDLFTSDGSGGVLFNGQPISGTGGTSLPNADILSKFSLDEDGTTLLFNGSTLSGATGSISLSVTNAGTGVNVIKGFVGNDLQAKTFKAGSNVTFDVTSDEIQINATLGGAVSASTTFKASDAYTVAVSVVSNTANTKLVVDELSVSANTKLLFPFNTSVNSELVTATSTSTSNNVTIVTNAKMRGGVCAQFGGGTWGGISTNSAERANLNATIPGTGNFTIEFELIAGIQEYYAQIFGCYAGGGASTSDTFSIMLSSAFSGIDRIYTYSVSGTTTQPSVSSSGICDGNKHHVAIVRNSGTLYLYVDGVLKSSVAYTGSLNTNTTAWNFGCSGAGGNPFVGSLRSFAVYNYAKYTAAFTPLAFYATAKVSTNTLDMAGKYLSSVFWKTISSMAVTSAETASAYLLWMLRTGDGLVWYWDNTNKVFVADSAANILTKGVTTSVLTSAMTNYNWGYKSDTIGFVVALVTTDGSSTPILTSLTLNAVQSSDKTAGHLVLNGQAQSMTQRTKLKFVGLGISDDAANDQTVIQAVTDSAGLTHNLASMSSVLNTLQTASGTVNGKAVDLTGLTDGSTLAFSQSANSFKVAQPAQGAQGQGLFVTDPFTVGAGQEVTITHQQVKNGRAVYQADQYIEGAAGSSVNRFALSYDVTLSGLAIGNPAPYDCSDAIRLPFAYSAMAKNAQASFPVVSCLGISYVVDNTIYVIHAMQSGWATSTQIYTASTSAPTTFTVSANTTPVTFNSAQGYRVYKYNGALYLFGNAANAGVYRATLDAPAVWTQVGTLPVGFCGGVAFIVGSRVYAGLGQLNSNSALQNKFYSADMSNLSSWTTEANTFPVAIGRTSCYQYGNYLYVVGGETVLDSVYSNKIYRADVSAPTVWTQIGTIPSALGSIDDLIVYGGKVFIFGGRINASTYSTTVFFADAGNPVSWTVGTAMTSARQFATKYVVDDQCYVVGGFNGTWLSSIEQYTFTPTSAVGSGTMTLNAVNTSLVQTVADVNIYAKIPASTSIQSAVSFDGGTTWSYYNTSTSGWVVSASKQDALASGALLTLVSGLKYKVPGLTGYNVGQMQSMVVALQLNSTAVNVSPVVYYSTFNYVGKGAYGTLLIGSYGNAYADIGIRHPTGDYTTTNVRNNQSTPLTLVMKVCDGNVTP